MRKIFYIFIVFISFYSLPVKSQEITYPREGEAKSEFYDGPYVLYNNTGAQTINCIEDNGRMVLKAIDVPDGELKSVGVFKSGFLPRTMSIKLKDNIEIEPAIFPEGEKIFAFSDIEGNFNMCVNLLQQHGIINSNLEWTLGRGHLVIIGDVFDRGNHQTELLWLIYALEAQASASGGYVHLVLGNHEVMNLQGDLRYVEKKYIVLDSLVNEQYGLRYKELYGPKTELGRWLRGKNTIVKIGNVIFVHAGLSPKLLDAKISIDAINATVRSCIDKQSDEYSQVDSLVMLYDGPLWYRGYFPDTDGYEPSTNTDIEESMRIYDAEYIVVGHTRMKKPESFFDGHIRAINVTPTRDHIINVPQLPCYGMLIENGKFFRANENGYLEKF